ncbi:MAG: flagellar export protein FliJ [Rhodomicrobiaceae bacterium]|jgi:flagellar export protein FliJ|nr:MAG: flagellar export protein FliJ [Methyloligella sp.]
MKSRETLIRLRKFDVDEKRQKVAAIEAMINDFKSMADDLDNQVLSEQQRAGVDDINHYAYPTFAKAAVQRRDNLMISIADLEAKMDAANDELQDAMKALKNVEILEERDMARTRVKAARNEQNSLDEFAQNMSRLVTR